MQGGFSTPFNKDKLGLGALGDGFKKLVSIII